MSSQQFCLKWNNHTNNMLNVFENLLSTEALVDVTLACDGLSLKAHKMVLSACSPFFQSLFLENPCKHPIVIMKDMSYKDLKAIIDFMYRGEVNVSQDQLSALLKTAETLKVKGLAEVTSEKSSGVVQQEVQAPQGNSAPPQPAQQPQQQQSQGQSGRSESPPIHGKRKRGRPRKRSLSDSNRSDDELVPSKIKDRDSPEIEELSGDASMEAGDSHRQGSNSSSQSQVHGSSVNFSSLNHRQSASHHNAQVEEPPSGDDNEFEVEPSKLLEQTLTTDHVPAMSTPTGNTLSGHFNLPSTSGIEISQIGMGDSQALVPVSGASDSLSSSHMQGPDSPQDIKPAILTFDEPPISPVAGPSHQSDRSMMMYMDNSSMPGTSFQDQSLVQHDSQPQGFFEQNSKPYGDVLRSITKKFHCPECSYGSHLWSIMKQHLCTHTGERPYKCIVCHKGFLQKSHLDRHMYTHAAEKPFKCDICLKKFSSSSYLKVHKLKHEGNQSTCTVEKRVVEEKVDQKKVDAKKAVKEKVVKEDQISASSNGFLKQNSKACEAVQKYGQIIKFCCPHCPYVSHVSGNVRKHLRTHTGERPYKCMVCHKGFLQKSHLDGHMYTHAAEKPFKCDICLKKFTSSSYMKVHKLKHEEKKRKDSSIIKKTVKKKKVVKKS